MAEHNPYDNVVSTITSINDAYRIHDEKKITLRMAAYALALGRLTKVRKLRGMFP